MSENIKIDWNKIKMEDIKKLSKKFSENPTTIFEEKDGG